MNEVEQRVRAEFEKILERDHGVSREQDRELIVGLWANLDPADISYASINLETGVRDLIADALESQLFRYYMASKRGRVALGPAQTSAQSRSTDSGYANEPKGLDAELLGGGGGAPDTKLKATTRARVQALSEYLSRIVATDQAVVHIRYRVLGDP